MTTPVVRFKSMNVSLEEIEKFVHDPGHLEVGRPIEAFGKLLPRELLGNWLVCAAFNDAAGGEVLCFTSDPDKGDDDPDKGDGRLYHTRGQQDFPTEHVMVPKLRGKERIKGSVEESILQAVNKKIEEGSAAYASGKTLVVFLDSGDGPWHLKKVARTLPNPLHFEGIWVFNFQGLNGGRYVYGVAQLDLTSGNCPTWTIEIAEDWCSWTIRRLQ
jgi:hypothetical protein